MLEVHQAPWYLMALTSHQSHSQHSCCLLNTDPLISLWKMWRWLLTLCLNPLWLILVLNILFHLQGVLTVGSTDTSCFHSWYCLLFYLVVTFLLPTNQKQMKLQRDTCSSVWLKIGFGSRSPEVAQVKCNTECVIWLNEISRFPLADPSPHWASTSRSKHFTWAAEIRWSIAGPLLSL